MSSVKDKIKGAFDMTFFFGKGIKPFEEEGTKAHALKSLWITAGMYPVALVASWLHPPKGLEVLSRFDLSLVTTIEYVAGFILGTAVSWIFAYALRVESRFWLFFQASNWMAIPSAILSVPFLAFVLFSNLDPLHMNRVLTVVSIYFAMTTACVAFRAFKINWELSVFLATLSMMTSQMVENLMFRLYHIPIDWIG